MEILYDDILQLRNRGETAALATVIFVELSAPRKQGAKMQLRENDQTEGTIGGGLMEKIAAHIASDDSENIKYFHYPPDPLPEISAPRLY